MISATKEAGCLCWQANWLNWLGWSAGKKRKDRPLRLRRRKKVAYAVYEYQADNEGEWGEIHFDFKKWKADIKYVADYDTSKTHVYARKAMQIVFDSYEEEIPDEKTVFFPIW